MKLYVWYRFDPDWSDGLAFAIANSLEEAKGLILSDREGSTHEWGPYSVHDLDKPCAYSVSGGS